MEQGLWITEEKMIIRLEFHVQSNSIQDEDIIKLLKKCINSKSYSHARLIF